MYARVYAQTFLSHRLHDLLGMILLEGLLLLLPGDLPDPGANLSPGISCTAGRLFITSTTWEVLYPNVYLILICSEWTDAVCPDCNCIWFNDDFYVKRYIRMRHRGALFSKAVSELKSPHSAEEGCCCRYFLPSYYYQHQYLQNILSFCVRGCYLAVKFS